MDVHHVLSWLFRMSPALHEVTLQTRHDMTLQRKGTRPRACRLIGHVGLWSLHGQVLTCDRGPEPLQVYLEQGEGPCMLTPWSWPPWCLPAPHRGAVMLMLSPSY